MDLCRDKRLKKCWTKKQTRALLDFYKIRQAEFQHSRKKKKAYEHVLDDMISAGFADENTTSFHLEIKITALLRAYKAAINKKNKRKTAAPCVAPFMKQMDEIFGLNSNQSRVKKISCGAVDFEVFVKEEPPFDTTESDTLFPSCPEIEEEILPTTQKLPATPSQIHILPQTNIISMSSSKPITQAEYFEKRLQQHERSEKLKSKRWQQYLKIQEEKAERHRERMKKLDSIINLLLKPEC